MIDDAADAIFLRWPDAQLETQPARRERLAWLGFALWLVLLIALGDHWL